VNGVRVVFWAYLVVILLGIGLAFVLGAVGR
jgi:hypothetical protein